MKVLPITFLPSKEKVHIERIHDCEFCHDTHQIELTDSEGFPSGYYKKCFNHSEGDYDPDPSY